MRAIINCCPPTQNWCTEYFSEINPYMIPVLSKPIIEFYMVFLALSGVKDILVLQQEYDEGLARFLSNGQKWGLNISYGVSNPKDDASVFLVKNHTFVSDNEILFINGFFLPLYDKRTTVNFKEFFDSRTHMSLLNQKVNSDKEDSICACQCVDIDGIKDYFTLNMDLLKSRTSQLIMGGYCAQDGVYMGMSDVIMPNAVLQPPFIIGDNVQVNNRSQVGCDAIIGNTCIVDSYTSIENSIVLDKTYVGRSLEIKKKILFGNKFIDPISGVKVEFSDTAFSSSLNHKSLEWVVCKCLTSIAAAFLILLLLIPFLIYKLLKTPRYVYIKTRNQMDKIVVVRRYKGKRTYKDIWFFKLSLDKLPLLWKSFTWQLSLVGDTIWSVETQDDFMKRYKIYRPAVFSYSESLLHFNKEENLIDDLYYKHNHTFRNDMQVVLRSFVSKLFAYPPNRNLENAREL